MSLLIPEEVSCHFAEAVEMYRNLHTTPELLYDLPITSAFVANYLRSLNLEVREKVGISGVVATLGSGEPCILLRADMDALPLSEESGVDFKSLHPGKMHACGHDGHIIMLLLAAKILSQTKNIRGTVKFAFQPAEEGGHGARAMRDDGVLENVSEVYGLHLASPLNLGDYLYNDLYMSCNSDRFNATITGKGGHGSAPHNTIDPIPVAAQLILGFNNLGTNRAGSVRIETNIVRTSETYNAIPTTCRLEGCTRSVISEDKIYIEKRMHEICKGLEISYKVKINFVYTTTYGSVKNHPQCNKHALNAIQKVTKGERIQREILIGEDFSYFSDARPGSYMVIGCSDLSSPPMHSNKFRMNEQVLLLGISYWITLVRDRLSATFED